MAPFVVFWRHGGWEGSQLSALGYVILVVWNLCRLI